MHKFALTRFPAFCFLLGALLCVHTVTAQTGALHPKAQDDTILVSQKAPQLHNILVNDYISFDYKQTRITILKAAKAKLEVRNDKGLDKIWYEPDFNDPENDGFTYKICDDKNECDSATVTIIKCPPSKPAFPQMAEKTEPKGTELHFDYPGAFIKIAKEPAQGKLSLLNNNCKATYTPPSEDFTGTVEFEFTVYKDNGVCGIQFQEATNMTLHLVPDAKDNQPPVATDDNVTITGSSATTIDVLANDTDPENTLDPHITKATMPKYGKLKRTTKNVTYTPKPGFTGTDSFTYTVCDYNGACSEGKVTVEVKKTGRH